MEAIIVTVFIVFGTIQLTLLRKYLSTRYGSFKEYKKVELNKRNKEDKYVVFIYALSLLIMIYSLAISMFLIMYFRSL
jgi:hypothetical protein